VPCRAIRFQALLSEPLYAATPRADDPALGTIPRNFKMIDRQMYGRASFNLLRKRVLLIA
jgi:hypothetical protein